MTPSPRNQFSRQQIEHEQLLADYLVRGAKRDLVTKHATNYLASPTLCAVPLSFESDLYMRHAGKLRKLSMRALVYFALRKSAPVFGQCSCRQTGCINPDHQTIKAIKEQNHDV